MEVVNNGKNDVSDNEAKRNNIPKAKDGGWGWIVVLSSFMHNCLIDSVGFTFGIFYKDIQTSFEDGSAKTQLLNSIIIGMALCTGPVSGALINRFGCRRVAIAGGVVLSIGLFLSTFSPNLDVMILLYGVVGGIGMGLVYTPSILIVSYYFEKRRALATGIASCGSGVGSFAFALIYEILLETYGWRGAIWIVAGIVFHCVFFATLYRPLQKHGRENSTTGVGAPSGVKTLNDGNKLTNIRRLRLSKCIKNIKNLAQLLDISLFTRADFNLFLLSSFFAAMGAQVPYNFLPASVLGKGLSKSDGAILISILGIATTLFMLIAGLVADYPWADSIIIFSATQIIGGVATCFLPHYNGFTSLAIYSVVLGIPLGVYWYFSTNCYTSRVPRNTSIVQRIWIVGIFMGISSIIGPPVAGVLEDMTGGYSAVFYFAGATFILGGITCIPIRLIIKCNKQRSETDKPSVEVVEITHM